MSRLVSCVVAVFVVALVSTPVLSMAAQIMA
jgi:hypothetical protein